MLSGAVVMIIRSPSARDGASRLTCWCLMETAGPELPPCAPPGTRSTCEKPPLVRDIKIFLLNGRWCFFPRAGSGTRRWIGRRLPPGWDNGNRPGASPPPEVARVLSATGLDRHLALFPTVADAITGRRLDVGTADAGTGTAGQTAPIRPAVALRARNAASSGERGTRPG
jgi:hypothetical protein